MNAKTGTIWRKSIAAVLALTIVAGGVPAQIFPDFFADNAIVASADAASFIELQTAVNQGGTVILSKDYQATESTGGAQYLEIKNDVTIDLNGHSLIGRDNVVIRVASGTLTVKDATGSGKITGGNKYGGVLVKGGTFILEGGSITGNHTTAKYEGVVDGSGVTVRVGAVFTMTGGSITGNSSSSGLGSCGGVHIVGGTFNFQGGEITNNSANDSVKSGMQCAGAIMISSDNSSGTKGVLNMTGGTISGNTVTAKGATCSAGIFCLKGDAHVSGGSITSNQNIVANGDVDSAAGAGICVAEGTLYMKGSVTVSGNKSVDQNVVVDSDVSVNWRGGKTIHVEGSLAGSHIGLDTRYVDGYVMTSGFTDSAIGTIFFPDEPVKGSDKKPVLVFKVTTGDYAGEVSVDYDRETTVKKATIAEAEHCTITPVFPADYDYIPAGTTVEFVVKPDAGYTVQSCNVRKSGGGIQSVNSVVREDGIHYTFLMPGIDVTIEVETVKSTVSLQGHQVVLTGDIGLVYVMNISDATTAGSAVMDFVVGNKTVSGVTGTKKGDYYLFTCPLTSKEMTKKVKATLKSGNTIAWSDSVGYSVKDYTKEYFESDVQTDAATNLIKAMLNYGAAAQEYFSPNTSAEDLANGGQFPNDTITWAGTNSYSGSPSSDIKFSGVALDLKSSLRLNTYFTGADSLTVSGVEGAEVYDVNGQKMISIPLKPWELNREFTITATKGTESVVFKYKPEYYCYNVFNKPEKFKNESNLPGLKKVIYYLNAFGDAAKNFG